MPSHWLSKYAPLHHDIFTYKTTDLQNTAIYSQTIYNNIIQRYKIFKHWFDNKLFTFNNPDLQTVSAFVREEEKNILSTIFKP